MDSAVITVGPRFKEAWATTVDWSLNRPAHALDEGGQAAEDGAEPITQQAGNYIGMAHLLGVDKIDPVLIVIGAKHTNTSAERQAWDWKQIVDSALSVDTEIRFR